MRDEGLLTKNKNSETEDTQIIVSENNDTNVEVKPNLHNPWVSTLFLAMSGTKPFRASDFIQLWKDKKISKNHPQFKLRINEKNPGYFTSTPKKLEECVTDSLFPASY